jgi:hypothetical protein
MLHHLLNELHHLWDDIGYGIVGLFIMLGIFWVMSLIADATAPLTKRIERTKWWYSRFGFRRGFWEVAFPTMLGLGFAAMVLTVVWGFATGRLPAH